MSRIVKRRGCNLHNHTAYSDGSMTLEEFILYAIEQKLDAVAITDHNLYDPDIPMMKEVYKKDIEVIDGTEFSVVYRLKSGKLQELHVLALFFDWQNQGLQRFFTLYKGQRERFIRETLRLLRNAGMCIYYEELQREFPRTKSLGTIHIAKMMVKKGYVADVYEALDKYIGSSGERRCYVNKADFIQFPSMEECIRVIKGAGGFPILAHPFYYVGMTDEERAEVIQAFKELVDKGGGGLEIYYRDYTPEMENQLLKLAGDDLVPSCGTDYHGYYGNDVLINYDYQILEKIKEQHRKNIRSVK